MEGYRFETKRVKLSDKIPMDTPFSVTMVPSSLCTFACTFCPARLIKHKAGVMLQSLAYKIIDNAGFPKKVKMLSLYNVGEPLLNPNIHFIAQHAKEVGFCERTSLVTNASLLTKEKSEQLIDSGLDRIIISIYGISDFDYWFITKNRIDFDELHKNIVYLNSIKEDCIIHIKVIDRVTCTPPRRAMFLDAFAEHCTSYSFEPILPIWPNFRPEPEDATKINVGLYKSVPAVDRLVCHYPFYSMVVTSSGMVTPCLADWDESTILGDARSSSLNDIWNSEAYQKFRYVQLAGLRPGHKLCRTCGTLRTATCPEDDIDGVREELFNKLFPGGRL